MEVIQIFGTLGVIFLLAFMVESLVEAVFGKIFDAVPVLASHKWTQQYIAFAVGIAGAFVYQFDLLYLCGQFMGVAVPLHPVGMILTGVAIGRGAAYLHDLVTKFFVKPTLPA
jgi:hypothetical protein